MDLPRQRREVSCVFNQGAVPETGGENIVERL